MAEPGGESVATWSDHLLDAVVVFLATWTVVYHLCLVCRLGTTAAVALEALLLVASYVAWRRWRSIPDPATVEPKPAWSDAQRPAIGRALLTAAVAAALVAAVATARNAPFALVWVPWLVSAVAATCWASTRLGEVPTPTLTEESPVGRFEAGVALAWALGLAVFSWCVLNPNTDDLFYVNLSQAVADEGRFPLRDTLFSHLDLPMANWPPVASYDALVGVIARILDVHAAGVAYVGMLPVATALSVLALWRLLRAWRVPAVAWALSVSLVFLLFDGGGSYATPGNLFLTRLWQGKTILLCVLVPVLLVYALRYAESPTRGRLVRLGLGSAAAVGLSTTAIFLLPVVAVGGTAPLWRRAPARALAGLGVLAAYPLGAGVVSLAVGGRSADDFGERLLYRFDAAWIGHEIFLDGWMALLGVLAVLLGSLLVPHPAARLTTTVLALATGLVLVPGATRLSYDLTGLGPTLWRLSWLATVAALLGVAVARGVQWLEVRLREGLGPGAARRAGATVGPLAAVAVLVLLAGIGTPIWATASSGASLRAPFHWQRPLPSLTASGRLLRLLPAGSRVLAPDSLSITLAVSSSEVTTVAPREYYLHYLQHDPASHYAERLALWGFVNDSGTAPPLRDLADALRKVGVDVVCTFTTDLRGYDKVRALGYQPLLSTVDYRCLTHT